MFLNIYLVYLGLVLICVGMNKHYKVVVSTTQNLSIQKKSQIGGGILLVISLFMIIYNEGISLGITYWLGIVAPAITVIALILTYNAKKLSFLSILFLIPAVLLQILN